jgi:hypothetical protein
MVSVTGAAVFAIAVLAGAPAEAAPPANAAPDLAVILGAYERVHAALADDRADGVVEAAGEIAAQARAAGAPAEMKAAYERLATTAAAMKGTEIVPLREQMMELSKALATVVNVAGSNATALYYCSMVDAYWLQKGDDTAIRNPYYGKSMLNCGERVAKVEE